MAGRWLETKHHLGFYHLSIIDVNVHMLIRVQIWLIFLLSPQESRLHHVTFAVPMVPSPCDRAPGQRGCTISFVRSC